MKCAFERRNRKTHESDERSKFGHLDRPEAEPTLIEMVSNPCRHGVALFTAQPTGEKLHDSRIGIQRGKRFKIGIAPWAKSEPGSLDDDWRRSVHRQGVLARLISLAYQPKSDDPAVHSG